MIGRAQSYGLPTRMARAVHFLLERDGDERHERKLFVLANLLQDYSRIPLTAGPGDILLRAGLAADECYRIIARKLPAPGEHGAVDRQSIRLQIGLVCKRLGVNYPLGEDDASAWARAVDKQWWVRALRKEWTRRFENTAIQLGQVGKGIDPYISRESAWRQAERNEQNAKRLAETEIECVSEGANKGAVITLAQAAAAGMADKSNRRGELMTRVKGFETIATELGHRGLFITLTAPSKYHSVGGRNAKYLDLTPREAQAYLCKVWARIRSALKRARIEVYGFRVAEPHEDGCPHWHLLLFCKRESMRELRNTIRAYALQEDGNEAGAKKQRVKLVTMQSGKGTASGYIAKYISKNIDGKTADGSSMGEHKSFGETEDGGLDLRKLETVQAAEFKGRKLTPSERVTFWSQVHGIRQFQQIGGAPVGVWRELRRIEKDAIQAAPLVIRDAWEAVQKKTDGETVIQADWAAYVKLQGGPACGRDAAIQLWKKQVQVHGRYGIVETDKPCGVWSVTADDIFRIPSVRYEWREVGAAAAPVFPWTRVNNCTEDGEILELDKVEFPAFEEKNFLNLAHWAGREMKKHDPAVDWLRIEEQGAKKEAETKAYADEHVSPMRYADGGGGLASSFYGPPSVADIVTRWTRLQAQKGNSHV